ncbi:GumC family protein [Thermosulfurimonas dismutans]|uniref:Lipopolysaccharide biosynthesis chain length determinant protein n=1 Tax=Thermosulfurimonas dismutans TaxID=999894 RepID=A0A179D3B5_9BACT|nr:GNVR domain-containing protein [Thermosulfurimonas dismutans]OAQ20536.1 Lipopolysaccharide biosynthesis chain length determinant protein [Thermosulfurimonas dismutans]
MDEQRDVQYLIRVFRRRKKAFFIPFVLVFVAITLVAFLLPPVYRATTTILIEEQQIPPEYVKTTVTGYVEQRLQMITQQIMSRSNLMEIIKRFDLYPEMRGKYTMEEIINKMRNDIELETISAEVSDKRTGRPSSATIAFSLSYEGRDPVKVQQVANVLASLYLEYNLRAREEQASSTTAFLEQEIEELKKHMSVLEEKISKFKREHMGELPEFVNINIQTIERLNRDLDDIEAQIRSLQERKVYLEGQLALVDPMAPIKTEEGKAVMSPVERLKYLRLKLISLRSTLSPNHPDIKKLKREIAALEAELGETDDTLEKVKRLNDLQAQLADLRSRLGPKHPDVLKLTKDIEALSQELSKVDPGAATAAEVSLNRPDNPAYINLLTQIASIDVEIKSLEEERRRIKEKIEEYQRRLENTPLVEKEYNALLRDYENARLKYNELMNKLMEARIAQELEESQSGERFTIIDPAQLPEKPYKPKRLAIVLIGFVLALGAGVGCMALTEYLDHSIKSPEELQRLVQAPVLSVFPYIETEEERRARQRRRWLFLFGMIVAAILAVLLFHFLVMPLDIFWIKLERKVMKLWI